MCDGKTTIMRRKSPLVMFGLKSYEPCNGLPPRKASVFCTGMLFVCFLIVTQMIMKAIFFSIKHLHPILEDETNRFILARHIGVDCLGCLTVAVLGWKARHIASPMVTATLGVVGKSNTMPPAGYEERLFTYHPAGFRIALFFLFFQVKNMWDTILWKDGPEFIFHHVLSLVAGWGGLYPGLGQFYAIFFLGLSEVSTAVLCVLANFDDEHGVKGLGEAFPMTKVVVGAVFVSLFILCRTVMWPVASFYFVRDAQLALKQGQHSPRAEASKGWIYIFVVSLSGLSVLQVAWLFQIFIIAKKEFRAIGLI